MPRHTHPRRNGPRRERAWRIERTVRIVRSRRARFVTHIDQMYWLAPEVAPVPLGDYLKVRTRGELNERDWTWHTAAPIPWLWLRLRQVADFRPAPAPPLCRCRICCVPLDEWAPDLRWARRVEHGRYDLRDGDPRWVSVERRTASAGALTTRGW